jgi:5-(carboxyamino)imidazole ribonucleotide mutase
MKEIQVGIVMGSDSDLPVMKEVAKALESFNVGYEMTVASAHRVPDKVIAYASAAEKRGLKVLIAGAGKAAHLPGVIAACTILPVIGVPLKSSFGDGVDSLYSIVQMPAGVPVATVAVDGARNAGILAVQMLSLADETLQAKLHDFKAAMAQEVSEKGERLSTIGYEEYLKQSKK